MLIWKNIFFDNLITDLLPDKDTFIVKIDIQGFECKVNSNTFQLDSSSFLLLKFFKKLPAGFWFPQSFMIQWFFNRFIESLQDKSSHF